MKLTSIILITIAVIVCAILFYATYQRESFEALIGKQSDNVEEVESVPPAEAVNQETGEIDQESFEEVQKVSDDDSLDTLETELDSTIILEEDFSDL